MLNSTAKRLIYSVVVFIFIFISAVASYPFIPSPSVEGYQMKGSIHEVSLNAPLSVEFSQYMNKASVEKNLIVEKFSMKGKIKDKIKKHKNVNYRRLLAADSREESFDVEKNIKGDFKWDGSKVSFVPKEKLRQGDIYRLVIKNDAKSLLQKNLKGEYDEFFKVVEAPKVLLATPSNGSVVPVDARITIQFNRPMIALTTLASGEKKAPNVKIEPKVKGRFKWLGTSSFQFIPEKLSYSTKYKFTIPANTESADGGRLEEDYILSFNTPAPELIETTPHEKSDQNGPDTSIWLSFNQPMDLQSLNENLFFYQTNKDKSNLWEKGINSKNSDGSILKKLGITNKKEFDLVSADLLSKSGWETVDYFVENLKESDYKKKYEIKGKLSDEEKKKISKIIVIKATKKLPFGHFFILGVNGKAKGLQGDETLGNDVRLRFKTVGPPSVISFSPENGEENVNTSTIGIVFSNPMDFKSLKNSIEITPKLKKADGKDQNLSPWLDYDKTGYFLYPQLKPATEYTIKVNKNAKDEFGQKLGKETKITFKTGDLPPSVDVETRGNISMFNGYKDPIFYFRTANVKNLDFNFAKLSAENFEQLYDGGYMDLYDSEINNPLTSWQQNIKYEVNKKITTKVNFNEVSDKALASGLYYFDVLQSGAENDDLRQKHVFLLTKTALTFKSTTGKMLVWATDVKTGQAQSDMEIVVKRWKDGDDKGSYYEVAKGTTDANGLVELTINDDEDDSRDFLIYGFKGDDFTVLHSNWSEGIDPWEFGIESTYRDEDFYTYTYTDRPIYRPGHKVYYKGIIRAQNDAKFSLPKMETVLVSITDSRGKEIKSDKLKLSKNGTFNGEVSLSESAATGNYGINVSVDDGKGKEESFYSGFKVAEYRKPDYQVKVTPEKENYINGEKAKIKVNVDYYFGAPLANAKVNWTVQSMDYYFNEFDGDWYSFSKEGYFCYWGCEGKTTTITSGRGVTNEKGELEIKLPIDINKKEMSQIYKLEVTAEDITKRSVSNRITFPVHKGEYYVGINNRDYVVKTGDDAAFDLVSVDFKGKPVANKKMKVKFSKREWNTIRKKNVDGEYYYTNGYEDKFIGEKIVFTNKKGKADVKFSTKEGGLFRASVESIDKSKNIISSATNIYVGSDDYVFWGRDNNDRIELVPDKQEYKIGDVAKVLIKSPYQGVKALVTYERNNILEKKVIELKSNSETLEIPITEDFIPNVFVSVVLMKGSSNPNVGAAADQTVATGKDSQLIEKAKIKKKKKNLERNIETFKMGYTTLFVNTVSKKLNIDLKTDKSSYEPRDEVTIELKTTDVKGNPVAAEVSIAVVDKSVLALTETVTADLINYFYRKRMLGVQTAQTLTKALARINVLVAAGLKGGGGGAVNAAAGLGVRSQFKDSAHWEAVVETDKSGKAKVKFKVPDNLTTWQILAIGVTKDTLVGSQKDEFLVTKDVLLQPVLPRFLSIGDEMSIGVVVHNKSNEKLSDDVIIEADGVELKSGKSQSFSIAPGAKKQVMWKIFVKNGKEAKIKFSTGKDALEYTLPINPSSFPEIVASSGTLGDGEVQSEKIWLPESIKSELGSLKIGLSPTIAGGLADGSNYLMRYPYGCAEQTASSLLPNLVLKKMLSLPVIPKDIVDLKQLDKNANSGIQRLYKYQQANGGWGLWENSDPTPYLSSYVLFTLNAAQNAGYKIDEKIMNDGVNYLRNYINNNSLSDKDYYNANSRAYALFVLSELKKGDVGLNNNLFDRRKNLGVYGKALLAMSFDDLAQEISDGEVKSDVITKIDVLKNEILNAQRATAREVQFEEDSYDYRSFDSDTRTTAIVLQMLSRVDPDNPVVGKIVRYLMGARSDGHWRTTQDTSITLLALIEYLRGSNELNPSFTGTVNINGKQKAKKVFTKQNLDENEIFKVALNELNQNNKDNEVEIAQKGKGKLYYDMTLKYFLAPEDVIAREEGITVTQEYFSVEDEKEELDLREVKLGDVVKTKLIVVVPEDRHYVVVEDFLPAGLEGLDFDLATTEQAVEENKNDSWFWWNPLWRFNHKEIRDDRMLYFADYLPAGTYEITYYARAATAGRFNDLPAQAFEMYTPEVFGRTGARKFEVVD